MKICSLCKEREAPEYHSYCRECVNELRRGKRYGKHPEKLINTYNPKLNRNISEGWKGWIAGIIDGEGCISVRKRYDSNNKTGHFDVRISVANTDFAMVKSLKKIIGLGGLQFKRTIPPRQDYWRYAIGGKSGWQLLELLLPYLVTKHKRALIAIELGKRITGRQGYIHLGYHGSAVSIDEITTRKELAGQIKSLNVVGRSAEKVVDKLKIN